jgi:regulator of PEP synthase PpsR (kinase-PPPase family)
MGATRTAFFVSDRTGITAETLGQSLLTQFQDVRFTKVNFPFTDSLEKAQRVCERINEAAEKDGERPLVFCTLLDPEARDLLASCHAFFMDFFDAFIGPLENELGVKSSHAMGLSHGMVNDTYYKQRMDAVNFTLTHDDGATTKDFDKADVILTGVSRCGKTPTCLYLALQFGIRAANFPLTDHDFEESRLPKALLPFRRKLYALTINPERLQQIRNERMPGSRYASPANCLYEVRQAEALFRANGIPFVDTSTKSIEEIATTILHETKLVRRHF